MIENNIYVEVHCLRPSWISDEKNKYRLYLNDELLSERDWTWGLNTVVAENIWVNLPAGNHILKIEPILYPANSIAYFALRHLKLNSRFLPDWGGELSLIHI